MLLPSQVPSYDIALPPLRLQVISTSSAVTSGAADVTSGVADVVTVEEGKFSGVPDPGHGRKFRHPPAPAVGSRATYTCN